MKPVMLKLVAELFRNSRKSDREMARKLGVSQPTVSRMRGKLESEGVIQEYTIIPDYETWIRTRCVVLGQSQNEKRLRGKS
jgi:DNA-binding Lrp family transcriptional regulator